MASGAAEVLAKIPFWVLFKPRLSDGTIVNDCTSIRVVAKNKDGATTGTWLDALERKSFMACIEFGYESWNPLPAEVAAQLPPAFLDQALCTTAEGRLEVARLYVARGEGNWSLITCVHDVPMDKASMSPDDALLFESICLQVDAVCRMALRSAYTLAAKEVLQKKE